MDVTATLSYASNLLSDPPARESDSYEEREVIGEDGVQGQPSWIRLYHRDKAFASFVESLFLLRDDEEETPPTHEVVEWLLESIAFSKKLLAGVWKNPHVTTDDAGGIRLSWREEDREVRVVVPADLSARYIYWQKGDRYGGYENFGPATLYSCLRRVNVSAF
jgi:hypothetical protein